MNRRRRSVLLASALTLTTGVAACGQQEPVVKAEEGARVYASVEECAAEADGQACREGFERAWSEHSQTAPRFADKAACEAEYACEERHASNGTSFFMPLMAGYVMGRMMSGPAMSRPIYTNNRGYAFSGNTGLGQGVPRSGAAGGALAPRSLNVAMDDQGRFASPRSVTTRGGFGQSSSYRGSAGG